MSCACIDLGSLQLYLSSQEARAASRTALILSLFLKLQACTHNPTYACMNQILCPPLDGFEPSLFLQPVGVHFKATFLAMTKPSQSAFFKAHFIRGGGAFCPFSRNPEGKRWVVHPHLLVQKFKLSV